MEYSAIIRPATISDVPVLAELGAATFVETFGHHSSREDLEAFLAQNHSEAAYGRLMQDDRICTWLAGAEGSPPIGYAVAGPCKLPVEDLEPDAGEIHQVYVRAGYQGQRLGTRLLVTALDWLASQKRAPVYVGVWSENLGAQRVYRRFGFEKIGDYEFTVGRQRDRDFIFKQQAGLV